MTDTEIDGLPPAAGGGRRRLAGATLGMAIGTTLSRLTGVVRLIAQTTALGGAGFADGYNLANTTPNIVTDIVIGGVLSATFVPVFVDHLSTRRGKEAWEAISAVVTVTITVLIGATVAFFVLTPEIIRLYTVTNHSADVHQQQQEAIFLLRWFVPQLTCYGLIALFSALLNARGKFAAPMFVPIANNLVVIGILLWFHALVPHPSLASVDTHHTGLVLLGVGTTLGVVVQAVLLIPSLLRADLHIRFLWNPAHQAMRTITRLAGWTLGWVVANQVALVVMLALADGTTVPGGVSAWTYAYIFFQLPYGVVAVSVMTAVTPSLSARWAQGDIDGFRHRMVYGLRGMLAIIIPSAVGMLILAHPLIDLVLAHGAETAAEAEATAATLAMFSLGLPGFCIFLFMVRVLQSMQDTRTAFRLYLLENVTNIVLGCGPGPSPRGTRPGAVAVDRLHAWRSGGPFGDRAASGWARGKRPHHAGQTGGRGLGRDGGGHRAGPQRVGGDLGGGAAGSGGAGGGGGIGLLCGRRHGARGPPCPANPPRAGGAGGGPRPNPARPDGRPPRHRPGLGATVP